jgi:ATP phosphoribosyltransferase regulatory subunit
MTKPLLPIGFYDLLGEQAIINHRNINQILEVFFSAGYQLIKTPLLEFAENFSDKNLSNSFYTADSISGKNLVIRNDITLQISRLFSGRLQNASFPLKICYVGDVFYAKNNELYPDRQQTQLGIEIIGENHTSTQLDVLNALLTALYSLQLKNLLISITLPDFISVFFTETIHQLNLDNQQQDALKQAIYQKNISSITQILKQNNLDNQFINSLIVLILEHQNFPKIITTLASFNCSKINQQLHLLQEINLFLQQNFNSLVLTYDIFGDNHFNYHQNIAFDIFCPNFNYAIAKGGCYQVQNSLEMAVGATIYANHLRKIL